MNQCESVIYYDILVAMYCCYLLFTPYFWSVSSPSHTGYWWRFPWSNAQRVPGCWIGVPSVFTLLEQSSEWRTNWDKNTCISSARRRGRMLAFNNKNVQLLNTYSDKYRPQSTLAYWWWFPWSNLQRVQWWWIRVPSQWRFVRLQYGYQIWITRFPVVCTRQIFQDQ
jgi:hypothetical protein